MNFKLRFLVTLLLLSIVHNICYLLRVLLDCSFFGEECYINLNAITFFSVLMISLISLVGGIKTNILLILFALAKKQAQNRLYILVGGFGACIISYFFDSRSLAEMPNSEWANIMWVFSIGSLCGLVFAFRNNMEN